MRKRRGRSTGYLILKILGAGLFFGGVALAVYYFDFFDTTLSTSTGDIMIRRTGGQLVYDADLVRERRDGLAIGSLTALLGLVLVSASDRPSPPGSGSFSSAGP